MRMTAWFKQVARRSPATLPQVRECMLGITGLPQDAAGLPTGAITAVVIQDAMLGATLLRGTLALNLGEARIVLLSMGTDSAEFDALLGTTPQLRTAIADDTLQLLHASARCAELVRKHGPDVLLDELAVSGVGRAGLLVVSQAERLFDFDQAQQTLAMVRALRAMLASNGQSLLLMFSDETATLAPRLAQALALFPNLAILEHVDTQPLLSVIRWQAHASLTSDIRYRLTPAVDGGWLHADGSVFVPELPTPEAPQPSEETIASVVPAPPLPPMDDRCGYMSPRDFLLVAAGLLTRPEHIGAHTLYRLPLRSDVAHLDALRALAAFRPGELATADQHHIHILLLGHTPEAAGARLRRLIGQTPSVWFTGINSWQLPDEIATRLDLLHVALHTSRLPDYTAMLGLHRRNESASSPVRVAPIPDVYQAEPVQPVAAIAPSDADVVDVQAAIPARTVHAHPLKLQPTTRTDFPGATR